MNTETISVDPGLPDPAAIARAAELIRAGRLVAFPTETVYGLGANALDPAAVRGIFAAKGRPASNPLIVHVADPAQVVNVSADWPGTARRLAERFWPGPLTVVVPKKPGVPDEATAGGPTVAVRCPSHPVARALIAAAGVPVAAPSANRSTELSPTRAEHVLRGMNGRIDLVLDGGPCPGGLESTVVDVTGPAVRLLRPGLITVPMLEEVVGRVDSPKREEPSGEVARSPGQMAKHYSPRTPVVLFGDTRPEMDDAVWLSLLEGRRVATLEFGEPHPTGSRPQSDRLRPIYMPPRADDYAAKLYEVLHELDAQGWDRILIELPPDAPEWAAVRDRLIRAAAKG